QDEVRLLAEVNGALPLVRGDRTRLRQVLQNIVDNAVKFSPARGEARVTAAVRDGVVRISVSDLGPGVPAEDRRLIFEKFGRSTAGSAKPGTGLGLFIARSIVEAHGGSLEVGSHRPRGSTFTVELPVEEEANLAAHA